MKKFQFPLEISQDQLSAVAEELGHEICVFTSSSGSAGPSGLPISTEGKSLYVYREQSVT